MKASDVVGLRTNNPIDWDPGMLEEIIKRRKEAMASKQEDEAMQKVEEVKHANTQASLKMMDRHHEIVRKSREFLNAQAKKRAIERLAQERREEYSEVLAEMALRNAERRDLLEAERLKNL